MTFKITKIISTVINRVILVFMILLLLMGSYMIYDNIRIFYNSKSDKVIGYKPSGPENTELLKELSEDCVAWLTIYDTGLDYPIMQGETNFDYLNKDPYGDYNLAGSIFLDSRNASDFSDSYSLVYGHHLDNKNMFGELDSWKDRTFFDKHLSGELIISDGKTYNITLFSIGEVSAYTKDIFSTTHHYPIDTIKEVSIHYNEPIEGNLIILSTCKTPSSIYRIILCGILTDKE